MACVRPEVHGRSPRAGGELTTTFARRDAAPGVTGASVQTAINRHPHRTAPVRLSMSLRRVLAEQFEPDTLRHLAAQIEADHPGRIARRRLSEASRDELAEMLVSGRTP